MLTRIYKYMKQTQIKFLDEYIPIKTESALCCEPS
jgi:hypothetical protein